MTTRAYWVNQNGDIQWGYWNYNWASDRFSIMLDSKDPITGMQRSFVIAGDNPNFGNYKVQPTSCIFYSEESKEAYPWQKDVPRPCNNCKDGREDISTKPLTTTE